MLKAVLLVSVAILVGCSAPDLDKPNNPATNGTSTNNGTPNNGTTASNNDTTVPFLDTNRLDLLFVIDNSGSMCQEQRLLAGKAESLFGKLIDRRVDLHVGITTTDMNPEYFLEPVAAPGALQSTHQPVPGFDRSCMLALDENGEQIEGDYTPIREAIATAVSCMAAPEPAKYRADVSDADIECALFAQPQGCSIASVGCGANTPCTPADLFPPPSSYRTIPKVLRPADYATTEAFLADFACASLVGTRGYGIEKGLAAAVRAVDPEMTGGPNQGFLRSDSKFGLVFLTDSNDCSHDGTLDEATACGGDVCDFANSPDLANSPLLETGALKEQLLANLRASKELPGLTDHDVFVGSIHGKSLRFSGPTPTEGECQSSEYSGISPSCASTLGFASSGDRYDRFLAEFPADFTYPSRFEERPLMGWLCAGDFTPALEALATAMLKGSI